MSSWKSARNGRAFSRVSLLDPSHEAINSYGLFDFNGYNDQFDELAGWIGLDRIGRKVYQSAPGQTRLLVGPGGAGKTRLACELAKVAQTSGVWRVKYLDGLSTLESVLETVSMFQPEEKSSELPRLYIVDDAEHRPGVAELVREARHSALPVQILLVARGAGSWWARIQHELESEPKGNASAALGAKDLAVTALPARPDVSNPVDSVREFAIDFARMCEGPVSLGEIQLAGVTPATTMVELMETALVVVDGDPSQSVSIDLAQVPNRLRMIEQEAWRASAAKCGLQSLGPLALDAIVALALMMGPRVHINVLGMLLDRLGLNLSRVDVQTWLAKDVFHDGVVRTLWMRSHRAAERHIIFTFAELFHRRAVPENLFSAVPSEQLAHLLIVLGRAIDDVPGAEEIVEKLLPYLGEVTHRLSTATAPARRLLNAAIPDDLGVLAWLQLTAEAVAGNADSAPVKIGDVPIETSDYAHAGTVEQLAAARALAAFDPYSHTPDLVDVLVCRGDLVRLVGRHKESIELYVEAVELGRPLYERDPSIHRRRLLSAVFGLRVAYYGVNQYENAVSIWMEEIALLRDSGEDGFATGTTTLAKSLVGYGEALQKNGRNEDALTASFEGVELLRGIVRANRDPYEKNELARAFGILGHHLVMNGDPNRALTYDEEAATIYRALLNNPNWNGTHSAQTGLAEALNHVADDYRMLCRFDEAVAAYSEGIEIYRSLVEERPAEMLPQLSKLLCGLSITHEAAGRLRECAYSHAENVVVQRKMFMEGLVSSPDQLLEAMEWRRISLLNCGDSWGAAAVQDDKTIITRMWKDSQ